MNKYFSKVTSLLLAGVMVFAVGCTDVEKDINNIQETIGAMDPNAPSLVEQLKALEDADAALEAAIKLAEQNAAAAYATKDELKAAKDGLDAAIKELQAKDTELKNAIDAVKTLLNDYEKKADHEADVNELKGMIAEALTTAKNLIADQAKLINDLTGRVGGLEGQVTALEEFKADAEKVLGELEKDYKDADQKLQDAIDANTATLADYKKLIDANTTAISDLSTKLSTEVIALEGKIAALETKLTKMINDNTASIEAMKLTISDIQGNIDDIEGLIEELEAADDALAAEDDRLEELMNSYKAALEASIANINDAIEKINKTIADLGVKVGDNTENIEDIFVELGKLSEKLIGMETTIADMKTEYTNLYNSLKKEMEDYVAFHALWMQAQLDALASDYETQIAALKAELEAAIATGDKANEDAIKALETRVAALETNYNTVKTLADENQSRIIALEDAVKKAVDDIDDLKEQVSKLITDGAAIDENLQKQIDQCKYDIELNNRKLVRQLEELDYLLYVAQFDINRILNRVQSIVYIPDYSDGKITINHATVGGVTVESFSTIKYKVLPENAASDLALAFKKDNNTLSFEMTDELKVRTKAENAPEFNVVAADADEKGYLTLTVQTRNLSDDFYAGKVEYAVALVAKNAKSANNISSEFTNVVADKEATAIKPEIVNSNEDVITGKDDSEIHRIVYTNLNPVIFLNGHQVCYTIGKDETLYTAEEMATMGYALPKLVNKTEASNSLKFPATATEDDKVLLSKLYEVKATGAEGDTYNYVEFKLIEANPKTVGMEYGWTYTYQIGEATLTAGSKVIVDPLRPKIIFNDVTVNWNYDLDATIDANGGAYERKDDNLVEITLSDKSETLPDGLTPAEALRLKDRTIVRYNGKDLDSEVISAKLAYDEKAQKYTVKLYFNKDKAGMDIWGKTFQVVGEYDKTSAIVHAELNVKMEGRPASIPVPLDAATYDFVANLAINENYDTVVDLKADNLDAIYTGMKGFVDTKKYADAAAYLTEIMTNHAVTVESSTINTVDAKDWNKNGLFIDKANKAYVKYDVNVYDEAAKKLVDSETKFDYVLKLKTWFGQEIVITKTLNLTLPTYKYVHHSYRVQLDQITNNYYVDADGEYDPSKKSKVVSDFSIAKVDLPSAFYIVGTDNKKVDAKALGLVPEFDFMQAPIDEAKITLDETKTILSYNGFDKLVYLNAKLYIVNTNGTKFEIANAFDAYKNHFEVHQFNPIGTLEFPVEPIEIKIIDNTTYTIDPLYYYSLMENRQVADEKPEQYNHALITKDEATKTAKWTIGNGVDNGFALNKDVRDLYQLSVGYNAVSVDSKYEDIIWFDPVNKVLVFDNTDQQKLQEDIIIPIQLWINSDWANQAGTIFIKFPKNVK